MRKIPPIITIDKKFRKHKDSSTKRIKDWCEKLIADCFKVAETTGAKIVKELTRNLVTCKIEKMYQYGLPGIFYILKHEGITNEASVSTGIRGDAPSSGIDPSTKWAIDWCNKSIAACFKVAETTGTEIVEELTRNIATMDQSGLVNFYLLHNSNFPKLVTDSGENLLDDKMQENVLIRHTLDFCDRIDKIILMAFSNVEDTGKESFLKSIPALWLAHTAGFESRLEYELLTMPANKTICTSEFFTNDEKRCQTFIEKTTKITMLIKQFQKKSLLDRTPLQRAQTKLAFASALNPRLGRNSVVKCDYDIIQKIFDFPYVYLNLCSDQDIDKLIEHVSEIFKNNILTTKTTGQNFSDDEADFGDDSDDGF